MFYEALRHKFRTLLEDHGLLDEEIQVETRILKPAEAIGTPDRQDYPLLKGKEVLMQATFRESKGQAFTDAPSEFRGPLKEVLDRGLRGSREKALFVASLNAVMRHLEPDLRTVHCRDDEPAACSREMSLFVDSSKARSVGLIGLQPAILEALVRAMGSDRVACLDRDEDNRGLVKHGVSVEWGDEAGIERIFADRDLVLATGSSITNGSLADILKAAERHGSPVYFYGTTIAGAGALMGLNRLCFKSH
jgi:hypothetical protein